MATWPNYTQQPNPYGERDRTMREAGTTPAGYYQTMFNVPTGAGATTFARGLGPLHRGAGTTGTVAAYNNPQNYREFSALTPDQRRAYMQANPQGVSALQSVHNQPMADQGYGPGASTWQGAPAGGYVPPPTGPSGVALGDLSTWVAKNYQPTGAAAPVTTPAITPVNRSAAPIVQPQAGGGQPVQFGTPSAAGAGGGSWAERAARNYNNYDSGFPIDAINHPPIDQMTPEQLAQYKAAVARGDPNANWTAADSSAQLAQMGPLLQRMLGGNAGTSTNTRAPATSGLPPINPGEDSMAYMTRIGMSPQQAQAAATMAQQNPGMSFQDIMSRLGTGQGSAAQGDYPPINPGEDSMAYMLRIGMSPEQAQAALAMAKANPGMSFQDIMARLNSGGGSTGNTGGGTSLSDIANGSGALGGVNGVPGYGGTFNLENWKDPGYDFRLAEGNKLLQGSAAARGNLLSGPTLKAITQYGQDMGSQEYQNAYNRFTGNRKFNYDVDVGDRAFDYLARTDDRNFGYKAQVGDRDYNYQMIKDLIQSGQYGTTGATSANDLLAKLISANTIAGGGANAAATIGGGNAATDAITRFLNYLAAMNTAKAATPTK